MFDGVFAALFIWKRKPLQTVNADLYYDQLDSVNKSLIETWLASVSGKGVILQYDKIIQDHTAQDEACPE